MTPANEDARRQPGVRANQEAANSADSAAALNWREAIEIVGFSDTDGEHFQLFLNEPPQRPFSVEQDLLIRIASDLPREAAAQMLDEAAARLRRPVQRPKIVDIKTVRELLTKIGGGVA